MHGRFRSWQSRMTNEDIFFSHTHNRKWPGATFHQVTAAHEIGHWLGDADGNVLDHIDFEYCSKQPNHNANNDCEYGRVMGKRVGILGAGSLATEYEAGPWLSRSDGTRTRCLDGP